MNWAVYVAPFAAVAAIVTYAVVCVLTSARKDKPAVEDRDDLTYPISTAEYRR